MANIYYLNQTPHSLWDLVADLGDHYGFTVDGHPPPYASRDAGSQPTPPNQEQAGRQADAPQPAPEAGPSGEKEQQQEQTTRSLGENNKEKGQDNPPHDLPFRGRGCRARHAGRGDACGGPGACRGPQHGRGCGPDARFRRPHPFRAGGHPCWGRRSFPFSAGPRCGAGAAPFDLPAFLQNLGSNLGIDLTDVLNNVRSAATDSQADFTPRADIFDTPTHFLVHVSLPGAQRPDISVDYDPENSTLRLAGVVYRPGVDEALNAALTVDGRGREVGVFEREVRLGTRTNPANIDTNGISAKLTDGVLVIVLPKVAGEEQAGRKKVSVEEAREGKEKEKEAEAAEEADAMHVDSETEAGDEPMKGQEGHDHAKNQSTVEDDYEDEEKEYVTVDVD